MTKERLSIKDFILPGVFGSMAIYGLWLQPSHEDIQAMEAEITADHSGEALCVTGEGLTYHFTDVTYFAFQSLDPINALIRTENPESEVDNEYVFSQLAGCIYDQRFITDFNSLQGPFSLSVDMPDGSNISFDGLHENLERLDSSYNLDRFNNPLITVTGESDEGRLARRIQVGGFSTTWMTTSTDLEELLYRPESGNLAFRP
ncbi:MAG: hypothetical protein AAF549_00895 [Pseudomonadota bacterium]